MHQRIKAIAIALLVALVPSSAVSKTHTVTLGKPYTVKLFVGTSEETPLEIKVRPLYVDGKIKEFVTGETHDVTEQTFVAQRAYRVNDSLPEDPRTLPKWRWQRGGWIMVDRTNGRITKLNLPDFDPFYSATVWYRDFAAYCGTSQNGEKLFAIVAQIGVRKPVVRHDLGATGGGDTPDSECDVPQWQRQPTRVTFVPKRSNKMTFEIHGRSVDVATTPDVVEEE